MRVRVPPPPPDNAPREKEDTQPFDLRRVKPPSIAPAAPVARAASVAPVAPIAPGAATQSAAPHLPPRRANTVVGALPSVMVDDAANDTTSSTLAKPRRRWL
jgi:hypothetical protein